MADIPILLVAAALVGSILNVIRGAVQPDAGEFQIKKLVGALIAAGFATLGAVVVFDVSNIGGPVQLTILGLIAGFTTDFTLSKLKQ